jgi:hypothetical protein
LTEDDWKMMAAAFPDFEHREREFITVPLMPLNLVLPDGGGPAWLMPSPSATTRSWRGGRTSGSTLGGRLLIMK